MEDNLKVKTQKGLVLPGSNSQIYAHGGIICGKNFEVGKNVNIRVRGKLIIGDNCRFGDNVNIKAEELIIGDDFIHLTPGLEIGGGGSQFSHAKLRIGSRCVLHNNYINLARPVTLGDDVGLSPDVKLITHGFWASPFEGYPCKYDEIVIGNNTIVGQGSTILMGAKIPGNNVIGAMSVVLKELEPNSIYAGNPARFIRKIEPMPEKKRIILFDKLIEELNLLTNFEASKVLKANYPFMTYKDFTVNLETLEYSGIEDEDSDKFRDFLRRYGFKFYTGRPFLSY